MWKDLPPQLSARCLEANQHPLVGSEQTHTFSQKPTTFCSNGKPYFVFQRITVILTVRWSSIQSIVTINRLLRIPEYYIQSRDFSISGATTELFPYLLNDPRIYEIQVDKIDYSYNINIIHHFLGMLRTLVYPDLMCYYFAFQKVSSSITRFVFFQNFFLYHFHQVQIQNYILSPYAVYSNVNITLTL